MEIDLVLPLLVAFFISWGVMPFWIAKSKEIKLIWPDMNKYEKNLVSGSGGLVTLLGFIMGVLFFIGYRTFILKTTDFLVEIFALLITILMLGGIGLIDDLMGWRKGGMKKSHRVLLIALSSIPLVVINAGKSFVAIPFFGSFELGIIYPLLIIPFGIIAASTTFNILAGYNGLEAGQGIIILLGISIVSYLTGSLWLSVISLIMAFSLLAFLIFNFYPAKVFPGDSLTLSVGGLVATIAILGNFERIAAVFFLPYILEAILKTRGKLKKQSFGIPNKDSTLEQPYDKIYGLEHLAIFSLKKAGFRPTEKKVVFILWSFQILCLFAGFILFRESL